MAQTSIGIQLYTLRDFTKTPADIAKTFERVKKIGYGAVQLSALGPIDNAELAKLLRENGLIAAATHIGWERLQNEPQAIIDEHQEIGCKHTAIGGLPGEYKNAEGYHRFAKLASAAGRTLKDAGITFSYHNHSFEFERFDGVPALEILRSESDPETVGGEVDTYWVQHGGGDPAFWIRQFKGRIPLVHFKDMGIFDGKQAMAEVGEGNLNWPEILKACKEAGVIWYLVEQDTCRRDPFESVAISLKNLKAMGLT